MTYNDAPVLGLSVFTDSSAVIIHDGKIISAVEEERLNRIKHFEGLPLNAIKETLEITNLKLSDINTITIGWNPFRGWKTRVFQSLKASIHSPNKLTSKISRGNGYIQGCMNITYLKRILREKFNQITGHIRIIYVPHHLSHAASAFYTSDFETSNILIADGVGESETVTFFKAEDKKIQLIRGINYPHSIGHLYASITGFLGFKMLSDEGKVMALASFGEDEYYELFNYLLKIQNNKICLNTDILDYHLALKGQFSDKWKILTGLKPRVKDEPINQQHKNLACSLQRHVEKVILRLIECNFPFYNRKPLCASGGLFLNSVLNGKISDNINRNFYIFPASGDNGVSAGSALLFDSQKNINFNRYAVRDVYWGRKYTDTEIEKTIIKEKLTYYKSQDIFEEAAKFILKGNITGWFHGKMEFGPRALGNRSILANAMDIKAKELINSKVKHRESFRPFAASILSDEGNIYFENYVNSPFMLKVFKFKNRFANLFPAVNHYDNTCRVQSINENDNPHFYKLLKVIKRKIGYGIVLNTSMNDKGEPIVNTPEEAIKLFKKTKIDVMCLHEFILKK